MSLPRDRAALCAAVEEGRAFDYLFFWGHRVPVDGSIGATCLSQHYPAGFSLDGQRYATAEHWMMAGKARLFEDDEMLERILEAGTPGAAKKLGRRVRGFDEDVWRAHRREIVVAGSVAKFGQNERLKRFLLSSSKRVLVEASPLDRIWGIGLAKDDARAKDPRSWRGANLLGFALMDARAELAAGAG